MRALSMSAAISEIATLPPEVRRLAVAAIAEAARQEAIDLAEGRVHVVFDPLECTPRDASACRDAGRPLPHEGRVCLAALEAEVDCPGAEK